MEQNKILPITDLGKKWLEYFKSIDCKYVVINLEDMVNALSNDELNTFNIFLQAYNEYRAVIKGKDAETLDRYFCVKRDDFPVFKDDALGFWTWVHEVYKYAYGNNDEEGKA